MIIVQVFESGVLYSVKVNPKSDIDFSNAENISVTWSGWECISYYDTKKKWLNDMDFNIVSPLYCR